MKAKNVALVMLASGALGWALENAYAKLAGDRARYSAHFGGAKVPFLPIYAVGGGAVALLAPKLAGRNVALRAAAYGAALTGIEYAAAAIERETGRASWAYAGGASVDWKHALLWAGLGLVAESAIERVR